MAVKLKHSINEINVLLDTIKKYAPTLSNLDSTLVALNEKIKELESKIENLSQQ